MSDRICLTHEPFWQTIPRLDRPRPCNRRGLHYAACENPALDPSNMEPGQCRGCVPRSATHGFLCDVCDARIRDSLPRIEQMIVHLRSIEKMPDALGERVDTSMTRSILVPDSWIAADGLMEALGAAPIPTQATIDDAFQLASDAVHEWDDLDRIINTREGAKRAIVLVRRLQTALRRWPDSEAEYRWVPYLACGQCRQLSLYRKAPIHYLDEILILCATEGCGYECDWFQWVKDFAPVIEGVFREHDRAARAEQKRVADAR